jgi:L-2-hydroxycarboxylate dehydrogenase (NAD+)
MRYYGFDQLQSFVAGILSAAGSDQGEAQVVAANLVGANLRGIDSHGIVRLPIYEQRLRRGIITSPAGITLPSQAKATALMDGGNGWGAVVGRAGMELAIAKARDTGIGAVTVINSNHFGYAAFYGEMALEQGLIGVVMTNANALMIPHGAREAALGTNPICVCVPALEEPPFVFDAATTVVARGKITVAAKQGTRIPLEWGVDASGQPTDDPRAVKYLSPFGAYKGYDLAVVVDILCGVLGGGPFGRHIGVLDTPVAPQQVGHFFLALDIAAFRDEQEFRRDMDRMLRELRASAPAAGSAGVLIAGDPERAQKARRTAEGIPVGPEIESDLLALAEKYAVEAPQPRTN